MSDSPPDCNCPKSTSVKNSVVRDVKSHKADCPSVSWMRDVAVENPDYQKPPGVGGGFIATPTQADLDRLQGQILDLSNRVYELERRLEALE